MAPDDPLFLHSLFIDGFRAIRSLDVPDLGRVNLFVGLNNAGKTSLLEALRLYAAQGVPQAFRDVLQGRGESLAADPRFDLVDWGLMVESIQSLFHGEQDGDGPRVFAVGGRRNDARGLSVELRWGTEAVQDDADLVTSARYSVPTPVIAIAAGERFLAEFPVTRLGKPVPLPTQNQHYRATFVPPCGIDEYRLGTFWDRVTLTEKENLVVQTLRIIAPEVEALSFVMEGPDRSRRPVARVAGYTRPVPLRTMGDGVNRVLNVALAIANAENGFLLIDEVENGIHYSVQEDLWTAVFDLASRFNVQVFATTHSWDTLVGFQYAANQSAAKGMLYRLEREADGRVDAIRFSEEDVEIAAEQQIEIR